MKTLLLILLGASLCLAIACQKTDLPPEAYTQMRTLALRGTLFTHTTDAPVPNTLVYIVQKSKPGLSYGPDMPIDSTYTDAFGGIKLNFQGDPDFFNYYLYAESSDTNFLPDETGTKLEFGKSPILIQDFTLQEKLWAKIRFIYKSNASKLSFRVNNKAETHTILASRFAPVMLQVDPFDEFKLHIKIYFPDGSIKEQEREFLGQFNQTITTINVVY